MSSTTWTAAARLFPCAHRTEYTTGCPRALGDAPCLSLLTYADSGTIYDRSMIIPMLPRPLLPRAVNGRWSVIIAPL